jgi:hypothetical protein
MKSIIALLLLLAAAKLVPGVGNDTDAVIARGLFPLGRDNPPLLLLAETVRVRLGPDGTTTTRLYSVRNPGRAARVRLATVCGGPSVLDADCGEVQIGGGELASRRVIGYLVDSGSFVSPRQASRRSIEECLKTVDGTVCGHEWATVSFNMKGGETREISLRYKAAFEDRYWLDSVVHELYLYTEKFWSGGSIPRVGVWLELQGGKWELPTWMPRGQYASIRSRQRVPSLARSTGNWMGTSRSSSSTPIGFRCFTQVQWIPIRSEGCTTGRWGSLGSSCWES